MKNQPTATPWHVGNVLPYNNCIEIKHLESNPRKSQLVALVEPTPFFNAGEQVANAELICRAINERDAMIEAVAALQKISDGDCMAGKASYNFAEVIQEHYHIARIA